MMPKVAGSNPAFAVCRERIINQLGSGNTVQRAPVARWVLFAVFELVKIVFLLYYSYIIYAKGVYA